MDKPAGATSHDVVVIARRRLRERRVGHTGTLDPFATGLLALLVGQGTRLARFLSGLSKVYEGTIRLGSETDSLDATGTVLTESDRWRSLGREAIDEAMAALTGPIDQVPPDFSAKKVDGVRAYRHARRGDAVALAPVPVVVTRFAATGPGVGPDLPFEAEVSAGTYIRALARDLGRRLGCGAHLATLRRTSVGPFRVADAVPPDEIGPDALRPLEEAVVALPRIDVPPATAERLRLGQRVLPEADVNPPEGMSAVFTDGHLVAVVEYEGGGPLRPRVVLAP